MLLLGLLGGTTAASIIVLRFAFVAVIVVVVVDGIRVPRRMSHSGIETESIRVQHDVEVMMARRRVARRADTSVRAIQVTCNTTRLARRSASTCV